VFAIAKAALVAECDKLIRKQERYARELRNDDERRKRRTAHPHSATIQRPSYWDIPAFNPYLVRANAASITRAVNLALRHGDYKPLAPIAHKVPKSGGETRTVSVFAVADAVVSRATYLSLSEKNRALMSARSYAYRSDLSTHDAIQYISSEFETPERIYIAEYDFSKYFDSISHEYLWRTLERNRFLITPDERRVVRAFLTVPLQDANTYASRPTGSDRTHGLPQGTSVSLFLANAAAWEMDRALERIGVGFVRYADDTLIWSRDYGQIGEAVNVLKRMSSQIGAQLNPKKSKGVRLFVEDGEPSEIQSTSTVDFVGYRFSRDGIGLRDEVIARMKARVDYLVWSNLLQAPQQGTFNPSRVKPYVDRDYQVLILQLRRYLYGNLTEDRVRQLQRGAVKRLHYPGIMSYFPLADDERQLRSFDGWVASTLHQALHRRAELLKASGISVLPVPHGLSRDRLIAAQGRTTRGVPVDLRIPSVTRFSSVLRRAANTYGANAVARGAGATEYQYLFTGM
jgi:RNA-directed DNA polymerase